MQPIINSIIRFNSLRNKTYKLLRYNTKVLSQIFENKKSRVRTQNFRLTFFYSDWYFTLLAGAQFSLVKLKKKQPS